MPQGLKSLRENSQTACEVATRAKQVAENCARVPKGRLKGAQDDSPGLHDSELNSPVRDG